MGVFFVTTNAIGYGVETHAFLTEEIINFYNKSYTNELSKDESDFLIDGSRHEDTNPRYLNHFYDPVNNRGLDDRPYSGESSKEWSQSEKKQTAFMYKVLTGTAIKSLLSADQLKQVRPIYNKTNFTWQKAVDLYAKGEKEQALFALGHVVHLIEDSAVPDHTRNDAHPAIDDGGSPYENWTKKFTIDNPDDKLSARLKNKKPVVLNDLSLYFDSMANYSNNNFYSRDSIDNFALPKPDYFKTTNSKTYGFKKDSEFGDYKLVLYSIELSWKKPELITMDHEVILSDYWDRLSVKAVQNGAGLLDLFFREAEQARTQYQLEESQRPFLASLISGFGSIFGSSNKNKDVADIIDETASSNPIPIPIPSPSISAKPNPTKTSPITLKTDVVSELASTPSVSVTPLPSKIQNSSNAPSSSVGSPSATPKPTTTPTPFPILTPTPSPSSLPPATPTPSPTPENTSTLNIIINEIQVSGQDVGDEFIELYNPNNVEVDISAWSIQYLSGSATSTDKIVKKNFESGNKIPAKGYFLIVRGKNSSNEDGYTGNITSDLDHRSFSMSGSSTGGKVFLVNDQAKIDDSADSNIVDVADYLSLVPESGKSIERKGAIFELRQNPDPQNSKGDHLTLVVEKESFATTVSGFMKSVKFFKDFKTLKKYIQLGWDSYPFIQTKFKHLASNQNSPRNWGVILFYYNKEASGTDDIFWFGLNPSSSYSAWGLNGPWDIKVRYPNCMGTETVGSALILPSTAQDCSGLAGNHSSYAFDFAKIKDNNLLLDVEDSFVVPPTAGKDYVTMAFYAYQPGYEPNNYGIKLVAIEQNKYFFEEEVEKLPPVELPVEISSASFDDFSSVASESSGVDNLVP